MATGSRKIITTMPTSPPGPSIPPIVPPPPSGPASSFDLDDKQRKWVVIGITLNRLLLPVLRDFAGKELSNHYTSLKSSSRIDTQGYSTYMKKDGSFDLNYGSINNNWGIFKKKKRRYDFKVLSAEDLAKLYLEPHMAKFTGFDSTCDLSAVLGMLANSSVFNTPTNIQNNAKDVRSKVRNEWGHCNFDHWTELNFNHCFQLMETLIRSLGLPKAKEKQVLDDLQDWLTKGLQLCLGCPVDKDLMKVVSIEVTNLSQSLEAIKKSNAEEANKISEALKVVKDEISTFDRRITELETRAEKEKSAQSEKNEVFSKTIGDISNSVTKVEKLQDMNKQKVSRLEERHDQLESTVKALDCRLEQLEEGYMKATIDAKIFQLPRRNSCFCGREIELEAISGQLNNIKKGCSESAICGLGGVGKTSLAVEYLWRQKDKEEYPGGIFWISGENNNLFQSSVSEMARQVGTFDNRNFLNSLLGTLDWMRKRDQLWCLVVDNLDELVMSKDMRKLLTGHWKQAARGHIIITTRREATEIGEGTGIKKSLCIELKCLTEEEGMQFLRMRSEITGEDNDFRELVQQLGGLPLALDQAAAYLRCVPNSTVKEYVIKFKEKRLLLLEKKKARLLVENTPQERMAVKTTWLLNFDHIRQISEEEDLGEIPSLVMHISAYLGPEDIPFEVINEELNEEGNAEAAADVWDSGDIVLLLTRFSLFQRCGTKSFSVHRLVQEVIRSEIAKDKAELRVLSCAVRALHRALVDTRSPVEVCKSFSEDAVFSVDNPPSLHLWGRLASHATYLQEHLRSYSKKHENDAERVQSSLLCTEETVRILNEAGIFFSASHEKVKAQELQEIKLELLVQLEKSNPSDNFNLPNYFIDVPLKEREYKVISCCMRRSLPEKDSFTEEDSSRRKTEEEANKLREEGNVAAKRKMFKEALDLYTRAINLHSGDSRLFCNRALCHLKLGQPRNALDDCQKCLSLDPYYSKALQRKAWALRELVASGQNELKGQERAALAMALHLDPSLRHDKLFCKTFADFEDARGREIANATQLAFALATAEKKDTFLLKEGKYHLPCFVVTCDVQIVGLGTISTPLICTNRCEVISSSCYFENISFPKGNSAFLCRGTKGAIHLNLCKISGGQTGCIDFPECNGGPGCIARSKGRDACDRTYKFGEAVVSGFAGRAGIQIIEQSVGLIENCIIRDCGGGGVLVEDKGSQLSIRRCEVYNNHQSGFEARGGGRISASENRIFSNGFHGILIGPKAGDCFVDDNKIFENAGEGILATGNQDKVVLQGNDIHHNRPFGISLNDNSKILIRNNKIFENGFWAILVKSRTSAHIVGNFIAANKCGGIFMGINYSGKVVIKSNTFRDNHGLWLEYQDKVESLNSSRELWQNPKVAEFFGIPCGEGEFHSNPPILIENSEDNNKEGKHHPREVIQRLQSGCTFCRRSEDEARHLRKCPSCEIALYCSAECQRKHRPKHKPLCFAIRSRYSLTVKIIPFQQVLSGGVQERVFGGHLIGIGQGPKLNRKSCDRFIIKIQTKHLNSHPLQLLTVYDKSLTIDGNIVSPEIFNIIMECGVLGGLHKFTSKKVFFWAMFADGGEKLTVFLNQLAPYQEW